MNENMKRRMRSLSHARNWLTAVALAGFAVLLYWGAAADWLMPRNILG
jgi:hypothetical protein